MIEVYKRKNLLSEEGEGKGIREERLFCVRRTDTLRVGGIGRSNGGLEFGDVGRGVGGELNWFLGV